MRPIEVNHISSTLWNNHYLIKLSFSITLLFSLILVSSDSHAFKPIVISYEGVITSTQQNNGKILIGGYFRTVNGVSRKGIARLDFADSLDYSFDPGIGANGDIEGIVVQKNGQILIYGEFTTFNDVIRNGIARLNVDGSLDTDFKPGLLTPDHSPFDPLRIDSMILDADNKILIGGSFDNIDGYERKGIARLNADGGVDPTFSAEITETDSSDNTVNRAGSVSSIAIQNDGQILLGGNFDKVNNILSNGIVRLNANGSVDTSFNIDSEPPQVIFSIAIQKINNIEKIVLLGNLNGGLARVYTDGTLDTTFEYKANKIPNLPIAPLVVQSNGKILIGGAGGIERLNINGSIDTSFNTNITALFDNFEYPTILYESVGSVYNIALQSNGQILIMGAITFVNGIRRTGFARLNNDGSLDTGLKRNTNTTNQTDSEFCFPIKTANAQAINVCF